MRNYEKPIVTLNEEIAEGVYAASGSDCWSIYTIKHNFDNVYQIFEVVCNHSVDYEHLSNGTTVTLTFSDVITAAEPENKSFPCSVSGNQVTITRNHLADSYKSGDDMTYKVMVRASDDATTQALTVLKAVITCDKGVNVQGNGGNE